MKNLLLSFTLLFFVGCANLVTNFDQNSYASAVSLKTESLNLISHGEEPASDHIAAILDLNSKLQAQLAYEEGKGKSNKPSSDQWNTLISPETNLLGRFLRDWTAAKTFSPAYVHEKSDQIGLAFDEILRMEGAKSK